MYFIKTIKQAAGVNNNKSVSLLQDEIHYFNLTFVSCPIVSKWYFSSLLFPCALRKVFLCDNKKTNDSRIVLTNNSKSNYSNSLRLNIFCFMNQDLYLTSNMFHL